MKPITAPAKTTKEWLNIIANTCPEHQLGAIIQITNPDTQETITLREAEGYSGRRSHPDGILKIF